MSRRSRKVSQNAPEMSGTGHARALRETGHLSRPASRPGTTVPLSQQQRFASWLAAATPAQVEAWKRRNGGRIELAEPTDDQLPEPLRGGALVVF